MYLVFPDKQRQAIHRTGQFKPLQQFACRNILSLCPLLRANMWCSIRMSYIVCMCDFNCQSLYTHIRNLVWLGMKLKTLGLLII